MLELTLAQKISISILPVIFAITLHEVAHGWVASKLGDQTARYSGRLTLNPLKHIDLVGTIIVPFILLITTHFIFGWAKPVPVDARNLRSRYAMALVALAGPIANLLMAIFWAGVAKFAAGINAWVGLPLTYMGEVGMMINLVLALLNCIPIPPLDGGRVLINLLPPRLAYRMSKIEPYGFVIILILMMTGVLTQFIGVGAYWLLSLISSLFGLN
jgi:Zn-dependent protease